MRHCGQTGTIIIMQGEVSFMEIKWAEKAKENHIIEKCHGRMDFTITG